MLVVIRVGAKQTKKFILEVSVTEQLEFKQVLDLIFINKTFVIMGTPSSESWIKSLSKLIYHDNKSRLS